MKSEEIKSAALMSKVASTPIIEDNKGIKLDKKESSKSLHVRTIAHIDTPKTSSTSSENDHI